MQNSKFWLSKEVFMGFALVILVAAPVLAFGGNKVLYVDEDAKGSEDGSANHPYKSISKALSKAKGGTEVRIRNGEYKENITIPKDVKVVGNSKDRSKVVIKADKKDEPVVTMRDDAELMHLTVKDGKHGVRVEGGAEAHIYNVHAKNNRKDGISLQEAPRKTKQQAVIDKSKVTGNGRAGVYAEKRQLTLKDTEITGNGSDGIDFEAGVEAWVADNRISSNGGSGAVFVIDGSEIWTKNNSIRYNKREGIEVNSYGAAGQVGIKKASLVGNSRYGIAKVARTTSALNGMNAVILGDGVNVNRIEGNHIGSVSAILRGF